MALPPLLPLCPGRTTLTPTSSSHVTSVHPRRRRRRSSSNWTRVMGRSASSSFFRRISRPHLAPCPTASSCLRPWTGRRQCTCSRPSTTRTCAPHCSFIEACHLPPAVPVDACARLHVRASSRRQTSSSPCTCRPLRSRQCAMAPALSRSWRTPASMTAPGARRRSSRSNSSSALATSSSAMKGLRRGLAALGEPPSPPHTQAPS